MPSQIADLYDHVTRAASLSLSLSLYVPRINTLCHADQSVMSPYRHTCVLQRIAAYCSMLQSVKVCCSVLHCDAVCQSPNYGDQSVMSYIRITSHVWIRRGMWIRVCCNMLHCVAVCCCMFLCRFGLTYV